MKFIKRPVKGFFFFVKLLEVSDYLVYNYCRLEW